MDANYNQTSGKRVMATAALILGISSVVFFQTVFIPFIFGGTAITLAILSKGYTRKMPSTAKVAVVFAGFSLSGALAVIGFVFYLFTVKPNILIDYGRQYDNIYRQVYGSTTEDALGMSYEELMNQTVTLFNSALKGDAYDNQ